MHNIIKARPFRAMKRLLDWRVSITARARSSHDASVGPYPISVRGRDITAEAVPLGGGPETFDQTEATEINDARMTHLGSLGLPLEGKRVLDVGCGVGHLANFFVGRDCSVVCVEGREENITSLRQRYPALDAHVVNVEKESLSQFGMFDVVFCYGLLYHLENPLAALRNMAAVCSELLLIETMVCDSILPLARLDDETKTASQALMGMGCRPSPSFVVMALNRVGFDFVYGPKVPPEHQDFLFEAKNNLDSLRDGHPLRCVFVASRTELENPNLVSLLQRLGPADAEAFPRSVQSATDQALALTKQQYRNLVKRLQAAERERATLLDERWSLLQRLSPADAEAFQRSVQSARSSAKPAARHPLARVSAARFDGVDDVLLLGRLTELQFDAGTPFTIEAWVKADRTAQGIVFAYQSNWDDTKAFWSIAYGDGSVGAAWMRPATAPEESVSLYISTKTDRRWHHIAVVYDGRGNGSGFRMYYDGLLVGRGDPVDLGGAWIYEELYPDRANVDWGAHLGNRTHADASAGEGEDYAAAGVPFAGRITDVRVWSIARWQDEIQQDALTQSPLNDPRLILELLGASLDGDAVARWRDTSDHHRDAIQEHPDVPGFRRSAWRPAVSRGNRLGAVQTAVLPGHLVRIE